MLLKRLLFAAVLLAAINAVAGAPLTVFSPDSRVRLEVTHSPTGMVTYAVFYKDQPAILPSGIGFTLKNPAVSLQNFSIQAIDSSYTNTTWKPVWGEQSLIRDEHRELRLDLTDQGNSGIRVRLVFRVFNEGIGFRYEFPEQDSLHHFIIGAENTEFAMTGDHTAFWIPGDYDSNEFSYYHTSLSAIDATGGGKAQEIHAKTFFDSNAVQTPLILKTADKLYISIHEAALRNYPAMDLVLDKKTMVFHSALVPDAVGNKAYLQTPAVTPWRTIMVTDRAGDIIASRMILNLNEPSVIKDVSWIKPQKFVGVWWEMHVGKSSWDYSGMKAGSAHATRIPHGANTANVKKYIDFAAKNGFNGVLVEGWNTGWEDWFGEWKEDVFDFVTPYPDFDVKALAAYAKARNVKIIMHHETSASVTNYERWMDTAYRFMKKFGYNTVKTGYVGRIIPRGEHHDGQWMLKHYERVARKTADYHIMVDMHEPTRPTGLQRTYPNWLASEAARGNEFNAWSEGNPPEHETILPFTRLIGGPMDYTPGIFKIKMNYYDPKKTEQVHTTLAKQLALYVTMYSPLQMAADLPENYEAKKDAFQFIKDVPVDWDTTVVIDAEPGDYIIMARKAKGKPDYYLGAISDEQARSFTIPLSFLDEQMIYEAVIYRDADDANWKTNPEAYNIERKFVKGGAASTIDIKLAPGGGCAIQFRKIAYAIKPRL